MNLPQNLFCMNSTLETNETKKKEKLILERNKPITRETQLFKKLKDESLEREF